MRAENPPSLPLDDESGVFTFTGRPVFSFAARGTSGVFTFTRIPFVASSAASTSGAFDVTGVPSVASPTTVGTSGVLGVTRYLKLSGKLRESVVHRSRLDTWRGAFPGFPNRSG